MRHVYDQFLKQRTEKQKHYNTSIIQKQVKRFPTSKRCLIANDEGNILNNYVMVLKKYFATVDTAENGLQAFELVKSHASKYYYNFIFLDTKMPIMNG